MFELGLGGSPQFGSAEGKDFLLLRTPYMNEVPFDSVLTESYYIVGSMICQRSRMDQ